MINENISQMLISKTPFDAMQQMIKTYKQALKTLSRISIFVINRHLQRHVLKSMHETRIMHKVIQLSDKHEIVYAFFEDEKELCKPCFSSLQTATKEKYSSRCIYIPIFYDQLLMFAV